jgi:hypothetical protein
MLWQGQCHRHGVDVPAQYALGGGEGSITFFQLRGGDGLPAWGVVRVVEYAS